MPDYRLYCIDGSGKITHAQWIYARNDREALTLARAKRLGVRCEVWHHDRLVGTFSVVGLAR
jgi:hypothetical protein